MRVIFLKTVENVANEGDIKEVKDGYAINYLIKNKLAVEANATNIRTLEKKLKEIANREKNRIEEAKQVADKLRKVVIKLTRKAGDTGKLYGAITSQDLVDALKENSINIEKKQIDLKDPVKDVGTYDIRVNLYKDIKSSFSLVVTPIV